MQESLSSIFIVAENPGNDYREGAMPFPEAPRVLYRENPLEKVVCQLRFPPILKIDAEIPASFQERIRGNFPRFTEKAELRLELPAEIEARLPAGLLQQMVPAAGNKNYEFATEDQTWVINLTRTFVSLSTDDYMRWEGFKENLGLPFYALIEVYGPQFFSRIGLRYINVFKRSLLRLTDVGWDQLLQPFIAGLLSAPNVRDKVKSVQNRYEVELADGKSLVRIISGFVESTEDGETGFMLDSDFSRTGRIEIGEALDVLEYFHTRAARLMRWSISETLHNALGPQQI